MIFTYIGSFIRIYSDSLHCLAERRTVSIRTDLERRECIVFHRKQAKSKVHTHYTSPVVWLSHCSASWTTLLVSILTNLERRECVVFA